MTYILAQVTDHEDRGLAKLLTQFRDSPVLRSVLRAYLRQIQRIEDATWEVIQARHIDGEGIVLDYIGNLVGRKRKGLGDTDYKIAIKGQIRINRSSGTPEDLLAVIRLSIPEGYTFTYDESYTGTVLVEVLQLPVFNIKILYENLRTAKPAGVKLLLVYPVQDEATSFAWAAGSVSVSDAVQGFGSTTDPTVGGHLLHVISS